VQGPITHLENHEKQGSSACVPQRLPADDSGSGLTTVDRPVRSPALATVWRPIVLRAAPHVLSVQLHQQL